MMTSLEMAIKVIDEKNTKEGIQLAQKHLAFIEKQILENARDGERYYHFDIDGYLSTLKARNGYVDYLSSWLGKSFDVKLSLRNGQWCRITW